MLFLLDEKKLNDVFQICLRELNVAKVKRQNNLMETSKADQIVKGIAT